MSGSSLAKKLKDAVEQLELQTVVLEELSEACGEEKVRLWTEQVDRWQADHSVKPDPYMEAVQSKLIVHFNE